MKILREWYFSVDSFKLVLKFVFLEDLLPLPVEKSSNLCVFSVQCLDLFQKVSPFFSTTGLSVLSHMDDDWLTERSSRWECLTCSRGA